MTQTATQSTIGLITRLSKTVYRRTPESALGMKLRDYVALSYIADHAGVTQHQLADILGIDANNLVLLLNELEQAGFARRVRDAADRRRHIVTITDRGRAAFERGQRARDSVEDEVLAALDADERETLRTLLAKALDG